MSRTTRRRGSMMLEFALVGIPTVFLTVSVFEASIGMWQYHTLEECAAVGARYVITHGADCASTCAVTVGNVLTKISQAAVGLDDTKLSVTLVSASTSPTGTTYNPISNSLTSSTAFPPTADGTVGDDITVKVSYKVSNPFLMLWPGVASMSSSDVTLAAISRQRIMY